MAWKMSFFVLLLTFRHHCSNCGKEVHITLMAPSVRKFPDGSQTIILNDIFGSEDVHFIRYADHFIRYLIPVFSFSIIPECQGAWIHVEVVIRFLRHLKQMLELMRKPVGMRLRFFISLGRKRHVCCFSFREGKVYLHSLYCFCKTVVWLDWMRQQQTGSIPSISPVGYGGIKPDFCYCRGVFGCKANICCKHCDCGPLLIGIKMTQKN